MNIKDENNRILSFREAPQEDVNPIRGGIAPTRAPGIIDRNVTFFRGVYIRLYKTTPRIPSANGINPVKRSKKLPEKRREVSTMIARLQVIFPDATGLSLVLSIIESCLRSVT